MRNHSSIVLHWGTTPTERALPFPCDGYLPDADQAYFRAVDVHAPAATLFRWLCQLKAAPYSYDWLDNSGHRSPRRLIPGLEQLAPGQRVMTIFELVEFEHDRHLTLVLVKPRAVALFGEIACSYTIVPQSERSCRLVVKMLVRYPRRGLWALMRWILPWGDLIMMRKQLLTLARLAERSADETRQNL
ncbi:MAG: hypothetical protein ACJ8CR_16010 [Roseiflexaceae bacterium]